jgi:hypothetical protein
MKHFIHSLLCLVLVYVAAVNYVRSEMLAAGGTGSMINFRAVENSPIDNADNLCKSPPSNIEEPDNASND